MNTPIFILTDFGNHDPFVGIMKGVIANIAPENTTIDLTQKIKPGDIQQGAIVLWQSLPYLPTGSTILAVIDPGVGTQRSPIILETQGFRLIGPDNGLFSFILDGNHRAWKLQNPALALPNPRMTFHGRDIFAPAAAHAALGVPGPEFGEETSQLELLPNPKLESSIPGKIHGEILHADQFGNLLTSIGIFTPTQSTAHRFSPWIGELPAQNIMLKTSKLHLPSGLQLPLVSTFAEIPDGKGAALIGSSGLLEIAANRQSAANLLNLQGGERVTLTTHPS